MIGSAGSLSHKPRQLDVFGTKLVAYRGKEDNEVYVLDGYCPHMGGDLTDGEVKGNSVVCPFHLWSWGSDGVCDSIPYATKIPEKAVIKSSAIPSTKYSCSGSPLRLSNGSTAIDGLSGRGRDLVGSADGACPSTMMR